MKIKVFADTICGWCYIGHSRLNKALEEFKDVQFEIEHMPFQLNPDMPKDGIERSRYLEIKFGSKVNAQPMYDRMAEEANKEGLNFNLDDIKDKYTLSLLLGSRVKFRSLSIGLRYERGLNTNEVLIINANGVNLDDANVDLTTNKLSVNISYDIPYGLFKKKD